MMAPRRCRTSTEAHASFAGSAPHFPSRVGLAVCFASGMAGIAAIFDQLATGLVVALPDDCYQGVAGLANAGQRRGRWTVHPCGRWQPSMLRGVKEESEQ